MRWLWQNRTPLARLARLPLLPASLLYQYAVALRASAYRWHILPSTHADVPVISVGNLAVGGTGKTPIASWIASRYAAQGLQPGIVLRGYGHDEAEVHRALEPRAVVGESPDRMAGIRHVVTKGADLVVLDDAFQRLDVERDLDILLISAEGANAVSWTLPAGPWREGRGAVDRSDVVVVTRKSASSDVAKAVAAGIGARGKAVAIASLQIARFTGMQSGAPIDHTAGRSALVVSGIGNPEAFRTQCENAGFRCVEQVFGDHHRYIDRDVRKVLQASRGLDYVVVTAKDAVKLRPIWPPDGPEPLVAQLQVGWESGRSVLEAALDATVAGRVP